MIRGHEAFVSYKSDDVQLAREITDQLIASGRRVWFAEYQILLQARDQFQEAILRGIRRSAVGLAITNDRYAESEYCRLEMHDLLERCGPERVLEIKVPAEDGPHRQFPGLEASPQATAADLNDALSFVNAELGWEVELPPSNGAAAAGPKEIRAVCMGYVYRLDISGWEVLEAGLEQLPDGTEKGPVLRRGLDGGGEVHVNVYAGPETATAARSQDRDADDREMYNELLDYLPRHVGRLSAKVQGVHLMFHKGLSQMAVTYRMPRRYGGYWTRKHSVVIPGPHGNEPAEFVFTFGFSGPFREYCRHAHLMDELVRTVEWD